jgi:hypothetical protein
MADLERYEIAGSLLLCRTCGTGGARHIVKDFGRQNINAAEMDVEISIHETDHHEVVFENDATENAGAAMKASQALAARAEAAARSVREDEYYHCYPDETAYRDGMLNGMGGEAGDLAALLGPKAARVLARALKRIAEMGRDYPELIQTHNRNTCNDFTCFLYGDLVEIAHAVEGQLT